jgi:hypothetical protein
MTLHEHSFSGPRAFARWMIGRDQRLLLNPPDTRFGMRVNRGLMEAILFRESCWQMQLVYVFPHTNIPEHRHNRVASCELFLGGTGDSMAKVGERWMPPQRGDLRANMFLIGASAWHGGDTGASGALWLSFQQWLSGDVGWITDDWDQR